MPEGPEIRRAADKVGKAIAGKVAVEVFFAFEHLKPFETELSGRVVEAVEARGKALLTRFAGGINVYSHNQLYGRWMVRRAYNLPKTNRQLRFAVHTNKHSALLYSASDIEVLHDYELETHPFLARLGPDLLDGDVDVADVVAQLKSNKFRRRRFASLLLDQSFLAGMGNYLRSEVLHEAQLTPQQRPIDLSEEQLRRLAEATLTLARRSYETSGVTNDLQLVERLKQQGSTRRHYRHMVFNRENGPCYRCGNTIVKSTVAGRRLYMCPDCQSADGNI